MPKKFFPIIALACLLCFSAPLPAAEVFRPGVHYDELPAPPRLIEPGDGRLELTLFVWYGCGACALVDPMFSAWAGTLPQDVVVRKLPTTYMEPWNMHARIFMALEEMGVEEELHAEIFKAFKTPASMVRAENEFPDFAKAMGLSPELFLKTYRSPEVSGRMDWLEEIMKAYDPQVVPSIVVDGRYLTDLGRVENPTELLKLAGELLEKARAERAAGN